MKKLSSILPAILAFLLSACGPTEPASISIDGKTTWSLDDSGQQIFIGVKSNRNNWTYDLGEGASWLTASQSSDGLTVNVSQNTSGAVRRALVAFHAEDASAQVVINQTPREASLIISCGKILEVDAKAGITPVTIETNMDSWGFESDCPWFTLSASGSTLNVSCQANEADEIRTGTVKVFAPATGTRQTQRDFTVRQTEADIDYGTTVLSEDGTSNCYIISHKGNYVFDATVRGNGKTVSGLSAPQPLAPAGAKLVWQSAKGMITSISFDSATSSIAFKASKTFGNALIAALDNNDKIIWSWHIWFPEETPEVLSTELGEGMMSFNLGALHSRNDDIGSYGLLYQWGRKDPFPGSPLMHDGSVVTVNVPVYDIDGKTVTIGQSSRYNVNDNNLAFAIANPTVCISNNAQSSKDWLTPSESNTALWGNPNGSVRDNGEYRNLGSKSYYDPCPKGWRVPPPKSLKFLTRTGGMAWATGEAEGVLTWGDLGGTTTVKIADINSDGQVNLLDFTDGWTFWLNQSNRVKSYFPATTRYDGGYAMLMGSMVGLWGNYWYNAPTLTDGQDAYTGCCMSFGIKEYGNNGPAEDYSVTLSPMSNAARADAYAIRCIKE